ncbi:hypothetical protein ENBRE01_2576, partial [Enteropsectra breve]
MLEELLIKEIESGKLLYGNPRVMEKINNTTTNKQEGPRESIKLIKEITDAPNKRLSYTKESRICGMKVNDVELILLYSHYDNFTANKLLSDILTGLKRMLGDVQANSVRENYFRIVEHFYCDAMHITANAPEYSIIRDDNLYIDVVERLYVISERNKAIKHQVIGDIMLSRDGVKDFTMEISGLK